MTSVLILILGIGCLLWFVIAEKRKKEIYSLWNCVNDRDSELKFLRFRRDNWKSQVFHWMHQYFEAKKTNSEFSSQIEVSTRFRSGWQKATYYWMNKYFSAKKQIQCLKKKVEHQNKQLLKDNKKNFNITL